METIWLSSAIYTMAYVAMVFILACYIAHADDDK